MLSSQDQFLQTCNNKCPQTNHHLTWNKSPIYSSLLFIFKHCIKSITAAKPAEAMDGSPKEPGREQNVQILLAYRCNSPSSLLRHNPPLVLVRVSRDFAIEVRLNILTKSGAELGKYAGRGKLNGFGEIHGTSFHGLGIQYLTSFFFSTNHHKNHYNS